MNKPVTKAVIPAAGLGTRFLPASKAIPKVMFPIIDKPIVQYVVEELVAGGITEIIFVISPFTREIKEHFEPFPALNELLANSGKEKQIEDLKKIENLAHFSYVDQRPGRHGIGVAMLSARELIGREPFILTWADEFYEAEPCRFKQLLSAYERYGGTVLGCVKTTDPEDGAKYGFAVGEKIDKNVVKIKEMIEKPGEGKAPSEMAVVSGHIFQPEIFDFLEQADKDLPSNKELYHVEGINRMLKNNLPIYGLEFQNCRYFDTGDRYKYLTTMVEFGLKNEELGEKFKEYLCGLNCRVL